MADLKSVYNVGANNGLILGLYMSVMFVAQAAGMSNFLVLMAGNLMMLGIPFVLYWLLVRGYDRQANLREFSAIWLNGIVTFICGSLILAAVMYAYLKFIQPDFIVTQIKAVAEVYHQLGTPQAEEVARAFEGLIKQNMVPTPISLAFSSIWFCSFGGSMLSMIIALIIRHLTRRKKRNFNQ